MGIIYDEGFSTCISLRRLDSSGLREEGWTSCRHRGRAILTRLSVSTATPEKLDVGTSPHSPGTALYTLNVFSLKINRSYFVTYVSIINFCNLKNSANAVKLFHFVSNYLLLSH